MAKTPKNQMKVKGALKNYVCTWAFEVPLENWSREALVANMRNGIVYAIRQKINNSIKVDEQIVPKWDAVYKFMLAQTKGDKDELAKMNAVCEAQGIKGEIQTHFVIVEADYMEEPAIAEDAEEGTGEELIEEEEPVEV